MERMNCIVMEDNILELMDEIDKQMNSGLVCCKCPNPCNKDSRCALAMKNLLTDIHMFVDAYRKHNNLEHIEEQSQV